MLINELAKTYNISLRTLRYYEEIGLLAPSRNEGNIRVYDGGQIEKLKLILLLKMFNFSLSSIKEILYSEGKIQLRQKLQGEVNELTRHINNLSHKKQLIKSLLLSFEGEEISTTSIQSFIEKQLFFKAEEERTIAMLEKTDTLILEIGTGLIPIASPENHEPLLKAIKETRQELQSIYKEDLKLIRVRDKEDLDPLSYQILYKDKIIESSTIKTSNHKGQVSKIIKTLFIIIKINAQYLILAKSNLFV